MASKSCALEQMLNQTLNEGRGKFRVYQKMTLENDDGDRKEFMPIDSLTFYSFVENKISWVKR